MYQKPALSINQAAVKCHFHTGVTLIPHSVAYFSLLAPFLLPGPLQLILLLILC